MALRMKKDKAVQNTVEASEGDHVAPAVLRALRSSLRPFVFDCVQFDSRLLKIALQDV